MWSPRRWRKDVMGRRLLIGGIMGWICFLLLAGGDSIGGGPPLRGQEIAEGSAGSQGMVSGEEKLSPEQRDGHGEDDAASREEAGTDEQEQGGADAGDDDGDGWGKPQSKGSGASQHGRVQGSEGSSEVWGHDSGGKGGLPSNEYVGEGEGEADWVSERRWKAEMEAVDEEAKDGVKKKGPEKGDPRPGDEAWAKLAVERLGWSNPRGARWQARSGKGEGSGSGGQVKGLGKGLLGKLGTGLGMGEGGREKGRGERREEEVDGEVGRERKGVRRARRAEGEVAGEDEGGGAAGVALLKAAKFTGAESKQEAEEKGEGEREGMEEEDEDEGKGKGRVATKAGEKPSDKRKAEGGRMTSGATRAMREIHKRAVQRMKGKDFLDARGSKRRGALRARRWEGRLPERRGRARKLQDGQERQRAKKLEAQLEHFVNNAGRLGQGGRTQPRGGTTPKDLALPREIRLLFASQVSAQEGRTQEGFQYRPTEGGVEEERFLRQWKRRHGWPPTNQIAREMEKRNLAPPRNAARYPRGGVHRDGVVFVLYVHNRPLYLRLTLDALSRVEGINETMLIVSHDGFFPEMDALVRSIRFCQVKQIYAPLSPHHFNGSFPAVSHGDCGEKDKGRAWNCTGHPDQFGNYRTVRTVSLKHHWWWLMNTVWDGLPETENFHGYFVFIEEDHFLLPNAYRNIQLLIGLKGKVCPRCVAVNLAPSTVSSHGSGDGLVVEKMGNIGYAFNRSVWEKLHGLTREFCGFDEYNWDITMWSIIQERWGAPFYSLRGSRASAWHVGECGLHEGREGGKECSVDHLDLPTVDEADKAPTHFTLEDVSEVGLALYPSRFSGWGGWGDWRDHELCKHFSQMYRHKKVGNSFW